MADCTSVIGTIELLGFAAAVISFVLGFELWSVDTRWQYRCLCSITLYVCGTK